MNFLFFCVSSLLSLSCYRWFCLASGGSSWFELVSGGFNSFQLVPRFSMYDIKPVSHTTALYTRSSHPEVFLGKVVLKICCKFTGEHPCRRCNFNKVAKLLYWNHTSALAFSGKFATYFQSTFFLWTALDGCFRYSGLGARGISCSISETRKIFVILHASPCND